MEPYKKEWPNLLKFGDSGEAVKWVQRNLQQQGAFKGAVRGNYKSLTRNAVFYFQSTHLDKKGNPLDVDGVVGKDTLWAIANPSGAPQKSNLDSDNIIPGGLSRDRRKFLTQVASDYRSGEYIEVPDGSNWGPKLSTFLPMKAPWCMFYQSNVFKRVFDKWFLGHNQGHCLTAWREAKKLGIAFDRNKFNPIPGDIAVMLYKNNSGGLTGSGHTFDVTRVDKNNSQMNAIGGNEGNRLKHGIRSVNQSTIAGWISPYDEDREKIEKSFERGIIQRPGAATSAGSTR